MHILRGVLSSSNKLEVLCVSLMHFSCEHALDALWMWTRTCTVRSSHAMTIVPSTRVCTEVHMHFNCAEHACVHAHACDYLQGQKHALTTKCTCVGVQCKSRCMNANHLDALWLWPSTHLEKASALVKNITQRCVVCDKGPCKTLSSRAQHKCIKGRVCARTVTRTCATT